MIERRCDRCRAILPDNVPEGTIRICGLGCYINDYTGPSCTTSHYTEGDLCDNCAREFMAWLEEHDARRPEGDSRCRPTWTCTWGSRGCAGTPGPRT